MRTCRRCEEEKPLTEFAKDNRRPGGRGSYCRPCAAARVQESRARNVEYYREYDRRRRAEDPDRNARWRRANPDKSRAIKRRYHERHRDEENARRRRNYGENTERHREVMRRWHAANPDAAHNMRAKRRALERAAFVEPVSRLVALETFDGVCGICGGDIDPFAFDLDHIVPLARGGLHCQRNVQPAHASCNRAKGARSITA